MIQLDELHNLRQNRTAISNLLQEPKANIGEQDASGSSVRSGSAAAFFAADFNSRIQNPNYDKNSIQDETLAEEVARKGAGFSNAETTKQNLSMAVAGFSVEDLSGAREEGYDIEEMEPDQIVTVIDRIKMHLAMGGKDISGMGGLSDSEIAKLSGGSQAMQSAVEQALSAADLPVDGETIADAITGLQKAGELSGITPSAMEYLLKQGLEPTVEHVYAGTFSQGAVSMPGRSVPQEDIEALLPQVEKLLQETGLPLDDRQRENIAWMLEKNIPITTENLAQLNRMQTTEPKLSQEAVIGQMMDAVAEGKRPQEAYLIEGYSLTDRAQAAFDTVQNVSDEQVARVVERGEELTAENLAREIRREAGEQDRAVLDRANTNSSVEDAVESTPQVESAPQIESTPAESSLQRGSRTGQEAADLTGQGWSGEAIRAQRVLEETRLLMTQEANLSLLKQGFSVDTTELTEVVERLRALENTFYENTLSNASERLTEEQLSERIELWEQTNAQVGELSEMPAVMLGRIPNVAEARIGELHRQGQSLARTFAEANQRYETMRTEVRRDLGDSMGKAFRNVDDILEDLGLETTESNQRAVRILAYNEQAITTESITQMKAGDELVQRTIKSLTPGVVAKMIQDGENPLDLSMEELHDRAEAIKAASASDSAEEKFSRFLYKAQQSGELTQEERDAFIGVYRLIYQVEKTDGAVIGQLLAQGTELSLRNLMTAVRTRRHENREYAVDDRFGFARFNRKTLSITDQIEMAFQTQRMKDAGEIVTPQKLSILGEEKYLEMTPDRFAESLVELEDDAKEEALTQAYESQNREAVAEAVRAETRIYELLSQYDIPQSPANLEAFSQMLADRNGMYRRLFSRTERSVFGSEDAGVRSGETGLSDVIDDLIRDFGEAVRTPEEMQEAQEKLEETAENVMKTMLVEEPAGSIDVRGLKVSLKQIHTMGQIAQNSETYSVPFLMDDTIGNMTLKIVRGEEENRGLVDIAFDMEVLGTVRASFQYDTDGVYGSVTSSLSAASNMLAGISEELEGAIEGAAGVQAHLAVGEDHTLDVNEIWNEPRTDFAIRGDGERPEVQTRVLYGIARSFIGVLGALKP